MKPNKSILLYAIFAVTVMAAAPSSGPANQRHARFTERHHYH